MSNPTYAELLAAHHAAETARLALAAELTETRRSLWRSQTIIRLPHLAPVIDFIKGSTADDYAANADELNAALAAARSPRKR
ncbi:hypothetical protein [Microbacterium sp. A93]|uniref:hypothetical protein n=1 Tax=Microbacterium sp. A93 TaxID=3450716 RepID=UPI003F434156